MSLWWCFHSPMTTMKLVVRAFMQSDSSTKVLQRKGSSQVRSVIRNDDFEKIFGKQEAAERRIRDLTREYRPLSKEAIDKLYNTREHAGKESAEKGNDKQQLQSATADKNPSEFVPICNETIKVKKKYVPIYEH